MRKLLFVFCCLISLYHVSAQEMPRILSLREQAQVQDRWLKNRCQTLLSEIMRREGIDMWLVIGREYNEDPVLRSFLPATWLSARRTTMLLIYDPGKGAPLEMLACARYDIGENFKKAWDPDQEPDQWKRLVKLIEERNPKKIAVNVSTNYGHADGLSAYHDQQLKKYLSKNLQERLVSAERIAVGWLETRTEEELATYAQICRIAHLIIAEGLSEKVITPGVTTTDDVVWYYRERIRDLGLIAWFQPTCDVQRNDPAATEQNRSFANKPNAAIIQPGDLVHIDFGIVYLGLHTDTQENAYILKPNEKEAPAYLRAAYAKGLRLMDILTAEYQTGRNGNQMLANTLSKAKAEGLQPQIYSHPVGLNGHAAGPAIGMWDMQNGVPGTGEYPLFPNTAYAIELNNRVFLPEWNKEVRIMLEENAVFDGKRVYYLDGRQKELFLVPRVRKEMGE
jgi:Xaa-Pro aminopeptidase